MCLSLPSNLALLANGLNLALKASYIQPVHTLFCYLLPQLLHELPNWPCLLPMALPSHSLIAGSHSSPHEPYRSPLSWLNNLLRFPQCLSSKNQCSLDEPQPHGCLLLPCQPLQYSHLSSPLLHTPPCAFLSDTAPKVAFSIPHLFQVPPKLSPQ